MKKAKVHNILYWVFTIRLSLGMVSAGIMQIMKNQMEIEMITGLGYPVYFLTILGVSKILGVITILAPRLPALKEWAYAGFTFTMIGALRSYIAVGGYGFAELFPPVLLLALIMLSRRFRPASRRLV